MAVQFARSPRYFTYPKLGAELSLKLVLEIDGVDRYTIVKNFTNGRVIFEFAELIRDYIEVEYDDPSSWSVKVRYKYTTYDGLNATGTVIDDIISQYLFFSNGYGYFEEGIDGKVSGSLGLMQTNKIIYKYADAEVRIPIDINKTSKVSYLYKGDVVSSETIASSGDYAFKYIGNNIDSFEDRVFRDSGTYEETKCIKYFLDKFEINELDEIVVETNTGGLEIVKVKNIEECKFTPVKVSFVNRFGAIQDVWFFKKSIETLNTKRESYNRFTLDVFGSYNTSEHQRKDFNISSTKSIKLNTGYVDESYNSVMKELYLSESVWMKVNEVVTPMNVRTNSLTFKTNLNDRLIDYSIDLEYSFSVINNVR